MISMHKSKKANYSKVLQCSILLGVIVFLFTFCVSVFLYEEYNFFGQFISELGVGDTALLFNLGLIISAVLLLPLSVLFWKKNTKLFKISAIVGFISFFALLCIGLFPKGQEPMHFYAALTFFALISLTILFVGVQNSINKNPKVSIISIVSFLVVILYLVNNQSALLQKVAVLFILLWVVLQITEKV